MLLLLFSVPLGPSPFAVLSLSSSLTRTEGEGEDKETGGFFLVVFVFRSLPLRSREKQGREGARGYPLATFLKDMDSSEKEERSAAASKIQRCWRRARAVASTNCPITLESAKEIIARGGRVFVICEPDGGHVYVFDHDALAAYCRSSRDFRNVATGRPFNRAELLRIDPVLPVLADEKEGGLSASPPSESSGSGGTIVVNGMMVLFMRTMLSVCEFTMANLARKLDALATRDHRLVCPEAPGDAYNQVLESMIDDHSGTLISLRVLASPVPDPIMNHVRNHMERMRGDLVDQTDAYFYSDRDFLQIQSNLPPDEIDSFCRYTQALHSGLVAATDAVVNCLWEIATAPNAPSPSSSPPSQDGESSEDGEDGEDGEDNRGECTCLSCNS